MSAIEKKFEKLIREYIKLKDKLLDNKHLKGWVYDAMLYDIEGFEMEFYDLEEHQQKYLNILEDQVKAFRLISKGLSKVSYTFG